ncbi:MAG: prenyltransferase/squalene oxidase repeat-containing protein [Thermomicrobiales bacterium]
MSNIRDARIWAFILALVFGIVAGSPVSAQSDATPAASPQAVGGVESAVSWLLNQQTEGGGFPGFSGEPDPGTTIDAIFALVAAESYGIDTATSIQDANAYLESDDIALDYAETGVGQAAKLLLALNTLGLEPTNLATGALVDIVLAGQDESTGVYGFGPFDHALAMLALSASGETIPDSAITALESTQAANGGWGFEGGTDDAAADSNTTSMVIQALAASGQPDNGMTESGLAYLETVVSEEGGAAYNDDPASLVDSNSTALVAQAVIATGGDPTSDDWGDLITSLLGFQNADGSLFFQDSAPDPNLFSTVQAVPALVGVALPIPAVSGDLSTPVGLVPFDSWNLAA